MTSCATWVDTTMMLFSTKEQLLVQTEQVYSPYSIALSMQASNHSQPSSLNGLITLHLAQAFPTGICVYSVGLFSMSDRLKDIFNVPISIFASLPNIAAGSSSAAVHEDARTNAHQGLNPSSMHAVLHVALGGMQTVKICFPIICHL